MQFDIILEHDRSRQPYAFRNSQPSAAHLGEFADSLGNGLCVQRRAVGYSTHVAKVHAIGGNLDFLYGLDIHGQLLIEACIVAWRLWVFGIPSSLSSIEAV